MSCWRRNMNTRPFADWLKCSLAVNWGGRATSMSRAFSRRIQVCKPLSFSGVCVYGSWRQKFKPHMLMYLLKNETLSSLKYIRGKKRPLDEERMDCLQV